MQDYKFAHVAVTICATLVNTHTHTQRQARWLLKRVWIPSRWQTVDKLHCAPDAMELHVCFNVPRTITSGQRVPDWIIA